MVPLGREGTMEQEGGGELHIAQGAGTGGNIVFRAGAGKGQPTRESIDLSEHDGSFIFELASGQQAMRIEPDGTFLVNGHPVQNELDVYEAFREWLRTATVTRAAPPAAEGAPASEAPETADPRP